MGEPEFLEDFHIMEEFSIYNIDYHKIFDKHVAEKDVDNFIESKKSEVIGVNIFIYYSTMYDIYYRVQILFENGDVLIIYERHTNKKEMPYFAKKYSKDITEQDMPYKAVFDTFETRHHVFTYLNYRLFNNIELLKHLEYIKISTPSYSIFDDKVVHIKDDIGFLVPHYFDKYFKNYIANILSEEALTYITLSDELRDLLIGGV